MSRISRFALGQAIGKLRAMNRAQKEELADECLRQQPGLFGSFLVQKQLGVSIEKMEFLLDILLTCFQAMQESGLKWLVISEDEIDRQMTRYVADIKHRASTGQSIRDQVIQHYGDHPEKDLLVWVHFEIADWQSRVVPEDADLYLMLAAGNIVNCIGFSEIEKT